uniref:NR LBD domain-containing protein n=1 Tax=Acrobeloides nanus TaxID=290746 RepID=A0A914CIC7_9BILA
MPDGTTPFRIRVEIHKLVTNQDSTTLYYIKQLLQLAHKNQAFDVIEAFHRFIDKTPILSIETLEDLYVRVLDPLKRVNLTEKEYVILKTLIYCYNALPDLSEYAKSILQKEADKYSKLLLHYQQMEYGEAKGAQKYAEVITLMGTFFHFAEKHRQIFFLNRVARDIARDGFLRARPKLLDEIMNMK